MEHKAARKDWANVRWKPKFLIHLCALCGLLLKLLSFLATSAAPPLPSVEPSFADILEKPLLPLLASVQIFRSWLPSVQILLGSLM